MINIQTAKNYYKPKNCTFVKKLFLICFLFSFCLNLLLGQENLSQGKILITERADYSVYIDGKYAARLTMKDGNYGYYEDRVVVEGTSDFALTLDYVNKFPITPQTSQNWTTELDTVNNKLKLKTKP